MAQIKIKKINEATVFIDGDETVLTELERLFTVKAPNYRFNPKFKAGYWDGNIKKYSRWESTLPIGLIYEVKHFAKRGGYSLEFDYETSYDIDLNDFIRFVRILDVKLPEGNKPHKYQLAAVWDALTQLHLGIEVPTSGGKTLILYLLCRFLISSGAAEKILIIVNTTTLVEQCYSDWYEYGWKSVHENLHRIYGGQDKHFDCPITISTWQSLYRDKSTFQIFDALIIDEAHGAAAKSLTGIANACVNAKWRIGTSGTYPSWDEKESRCNYLNIVGSLGRIKKYTTYQEMEARGQVAKMEIIAIILKYPLKFRKLIRDNFAGNYAKELDEIHNNTLRMEFIGKLANSLNKNTLILFTKVQKHGIPLKAYLEKHCPNKKIIYIDGGVKTSERNLTREIAEKSENLIILASYGTFSVGVSIRNIHNVILASGYKSKTKVLQAIGRGLRRIKDRKEHLSVFDIVDDCATSPGKDSFGNSVKGYNNFSNKHYKERIKIYDRVGFKWKSIVRKLTE